MLQKSSSDCKETFTATPRYIAVPRLRGQPATLATELETLGYCFMDIATDQNLHWKHAPLNSPQAIDMKLAPMACKTYFEKVVVERISVSSLKEPARQLQQLFSPCNEQPADLRSFVACFSGV